jgi:hypothetical protein
MHFSSSGTTHPTVRPNSDQITSRHRPAIAANVALLGGPIDIKPG